MNIVWVCAFILIVIFLTDLVMHFCNLYKYRIVKFLSVLVMCFGYPVYFALSLILTLYFGFLFDNAGSLKFYGILFMFLCMIIFAILRYASFRYIINDISLYTYSKFYFFTCVFLPFYIISFYNEMGLAIAIQLVLPAFVAITIFYSIVKILVIKKYNIIGAVHDF